MIEARLNFAFHAPAHAAGPIEPELFRLLAGIQETGSLTKGARKAGISYRHAWGLIEKWQERLCQPLALLERGRGAKLAPLGEKLLWADRHARERLSAGLGGVASELKQDFARAFAQSPPRLLVHASHDLALATLREFMRQEFAVDLDLHFHGSADSLAALARSRADLAGFHVSEASLESEIPAPIRRSLRPKAQKLIAFVAREQGLMLAPGNPKAIRGVADLARPGVRFVNRQPGSGTRIELDALLREHGMQAESVRGYESEEFTHVAVAAMIATGMADAGLGIRAAATQYRLDFLPLLRERYYFACHREALERPAVQALLGALRSGVFRQIVGNLPGYDASGAGQILEIADVMCLADAHAAPGTPQR